MDTPAKPSADVLEAFGIAYEPVLLMGGQRTTWKAGDSVMKPVDSIEETVWRAETIEKLPQDSLRIARHRKTKQGEWIYQGWSVLETIAGEHVRHRWGEKVSVCKEFNNLLIGIPKPDFIDTRTDPWAIASKMTWEELPLSYDERLKPSVEKITSYFKPIATTDQIIHGDITGNMLFADGMLPGIIDFTPTWRAKEYALGILIVDALTWEDADESIFALVEDEYEMFQFLLRASLFRMLVLSEFKKQNNIDRLSELPRDEKTLDIIIDRFIHVQGI